MSVVSSVTSPLPPMLSAMLPRRTDRAIFIGATGSGKTTLARLLLTARPYVVVHDGKGTLNWPGYRLVRRLRDLAALDARAFPRLIYRPDVEEAMDPRTVNRFFWWVYRRKRTTLYVDEVYAAVEPSAGVVPAGLQACVTRGREPGVGVEVWSSVQRPTRIPLALLSETEHYYVFRLTFREDRKRVEECTGLDEESISLLPKRHFYYVPVGDDPEGPLTLRFP